MLLWCQKSASSEDEREFSRRVQVALLGKAVERLDAANEALLQELERVQESNPPVPGHPSEKFLELVALKADVRVRDLEIEEARRASEAMRKLKAETLEEYKDQVIPTHKKIVWFENKVQEIHAQRTGKRKAEHAWRRSVDNEAWLMQWPRFKEKADQENLRRRVRRAYTYSLEGFSPLNQLPRVFAGLAPERTNPIDGMEDDKGLRLNFRDGHHLALVKMIDQGRHHCDASPNEPLWFMRFEPNHGVSFQFDDPLQREAKIQEWKTKLGEAWLHCLSYGAGYSGQQGACLYVPASKVSNVVRILDLNLLRASELFPVSHR